MPITWIAQQSNFRTPVTKSLVTSYNVQVTASASLSTSYTIKLAVAKTLAANWHMRSSFTGRRVQVVVDAFNGLGLGTAVTSAPVGPIDGIASVVKTLTPSYNLVARVIKTVNASYNIETGVSKSITASYNVRFALAKTSSATYNTKTAVAKSLSASYSVKTAVSKVVTSSYIVRGIVSKSLTVTYSDTVAIQKQLAVTYLITTTTPVSKSLVTSYNINVTQQTERIFGFYGYGDEVNERRKRLKSREPIITTPVRVDLTAEYMILAPEVLATSTSTEYGLGEVWQEPLYVTDIVGEVVELLVAGVI